MRGVLVWGLAVAATAAYSLWSGGWHSASGLLYDVPVNLLASRYYASAVTRFPRAWPDALRAFLAFPAIVLSFLRHGLHAPYHGHLTMALIVGLIEAGDRRNPAVGRWAALLPALIVLAVNLSRGEAVFDPENRNALVLGLAIGLVGAVLLARATRKDGAVS